MEDIIDMYKKSNQLIFIFELLFITAGSEAKKPIRFAIALIVAVALYKPVSNAIMKNTQIDENIEQAISRAGSKGGNKGYDCALSAIEMVNLMKQL